MRLSDIGIYREVKSDEWGTHLCFYKVVPPSKCVSGCKFGYTKQIDRYEYDRILAAQNGPVKHRDLVKDDGEPISAMQAGRRV